MKKIVAAAAFILFSMPLSAAEIAPRGFADSVHAVQLGEEGSMFNSKTRARLGLEASADDSLLFLSLDAIHNAVIESQTGFFLHEAYAEYVSDLWDIRVGRQIITWGKADGIRITDLISPSDMTEFIALEFDDVRMPVDAVKFRFLGENMNVELIGIPVFTPGKGAPADSPWHIAPQLPESGNVRMNKAEEPELNYESVEGAAKLSLFLPGVDLAFSAMYLWDDFPVIDGETEGETVVFTPRYHRVGVFGAEAAVPAGDFVLRSEAAFYLNRHFQVRDFMSGEKSHMINWMVGTDWYPGSNWTISAQFSGKSLLEHSEKMIEREHTWMGTLNIKKKLLRETLTIGNMLYLGFNEPDVMNRTSIEYALTDEFHIFGGVDLFFGDNGTFGRFSDNKLGWIKAKYSY